MKKVLIINWDSYPHNSSGGVYTWEKILIDAMPNYEFVIVNQISNPNINGKYVVPKHVTQVIGVPIYGTARFEEYTQCNDHLVPRIIRTTKSIVREMFVPLYKEFITQIISEHCNIKVLTDTVIKIHELFLIYDSKKCLDDPATWQIFIGELEKEPLYGSVLIFEAKLIYTQLQRSIQFLATNVPKVDIIHCSLVWLPSLLAICAKKESNCPMVVTEHGVAFRETLLIQNALLFGESSKIFSKVIANNIVKTIYSAADLIAPVCQTNREWEERLGATPSKIRVIYNGIDTSRFKPIQIPRDCKRPTIVTVARISHVKDIVLLIQSVSYAIKEIPDLQCLIYGTAVDLEYARMCVRAVKELNLENNVKFMGSTKEPEKVYNAADLVVISSITEGFPFTVIEAMACGKAIVASDVGGVWEALEGCGLLVRSRRPLQLAQAIVRLIKDEDLRHKFEKESLKKACERFSLKNCIGEYVKIYAELMEPNKPKVLPKEVALN